jgi:hypothetical protein
MRKVPNSVEVEFYAGGRTREIPFCVNDSVTFVSGVHAGMIASVICVESVAPEVRFLVELPSGEGVVAPVSTLVRYDAES